MTLDLDGVAKSAKQGSGSTLLAMPLPCNDWLSDSEAKSPNLREGDSEPPPPLILSFPCFLDHRFNLSATGPSMNSYVVSPNGNHHAQILTHVHLKSIPVWYDAAQ